MTDKRAAIREHIEAAAGIAIIAAVWLLWMGVPA